MDKYLLYPGYVVSETDGKRHYITAKALMKLYNVPPEECVVWIPYRPYPNQDKLIALHPMANGKYKDMQKQEEEEGFITHSEKTLTGIEAVKNSLDQIEIKLPISDVDTGGER